MLPDAARCHQIPPDAALIATFLLQAAFDVVLLALAAAVASLHQADGYQRVLAQPVAAVLRQLELLVSSLLRLLSKALSTLVMILWNYALSKAIAVDLSPSDLERVGRRLWFLWAFSLTTGLSVCAVRLTGLRVSLLRQQTAIEQAEAERAARDVAWHGDSALAEPPSTVTLLCRGARHHCRRVTWRGELMSLCAVLEATFGWVTGCAWTNFVGVVWSSLDDYPSWGAACTLSLICPYMAGAGLNLSLTWQVRHAPVP